jgi:hypothetical protein
MIWDWINSLALFIRKLFAFPDIPLFIPAIDPNAFCPGCGNRQGSLLAETQKDGTVLIRHRCSICGAKWYEKPVLRAPQAASSATVVITADAPAKE